MDIYRPALYRMDPPSATIPMMKCGKTKTSSKKPTFCTKKHSCSLIPSCSTKKVSSASKLNPSCSVTKSAKSQKVRPYEPSLVPRPSYLPGSYTGSRNGTVGFPYECGPPEYSELFGAERENFWLVPPTIPPIYRPETPKSERKKKKKKVKRGKKESTSSSLWKVMRRMFSVSSSSSVDVSMDVSPPPMVAVIHV